MKELMPTEIKITVGNTNKTYGIFFNTSGLKWLEKLIGKPFMVFAGELCSIAPGANGGDESVSDSSRIYEKLSTTNCVNMMVAGLNGWRYHEYRRNGRVGPEYTEDDAFYIIDHSGGVMEAMGPVVTAFMEAIASQKVFKDAIEKVKADADTKAESEAVGGDVADPTTQPTEPTGI